MKDQRDAEYQELVDSLIGPLSVQLQFGTRKDKAEVLEEVERIGKEAAPLIPKILEAYKAGENWVFPFQLVQILERTGETSIIGALREKGAIAKLALADQVVLFRHGAKELENDLLRFLFEKRNDTECWERREVAEAMGTRGSALAALVLKAILAEITQPLNERVLRDNDEIQSPDQLLELLRLASQTQFRDAVRAALHSIVERGAA